MNSRFIQEASEACFNGCCSSPFSPQSLTQKPEEEELEFSVITSGASFLTREIKFTSQESLPPLRTSFYDLITAFPDYLQTTQADHLRTTEYQNLSSSSSSHHVLLNHTSQQQPLFSYSQFRQISESKPDLNPSLFTLSSKQVSSGKELLSLASEESLFQSTMRKRIISFMNLEESEYHMILTQDRSSAFKLLAELYSFKSNPNLLTVYNYEDEAVEEMIRISEKKGIKHESAEFSWPSTEIVSEKLKRKLSRGKRRRGKEDKRGLFVFPLQSLVTGASYSYSWMSLAHENEWHVLLDTSALGSKDMETLGLSLFQPDFLISSFTEVLGKYDPSSGFGCLFVKKSCSQALSEELELITNPANLTAVIAEPAWITENDETTLEKGCLDHVDHNKASTSATDIIEIGEEEEDKAVIEFRGLDHADSLGLILLSRRSKSLTLWLVRALTSLQHPGFHETEMPLVKICGPKTRPNRGPSISFNVFDWQGEKIDPLIVERLAEREKIGLRCAYLQRIRIGKNKRRRSDHEKENLSLTVSVVCVRLGFMTNFDDVFNVWRFVSRFLDADFVEKEKWRMKALEKNK